MYFATFVTARMRNLTISARHVLGHDAYNFAVAALHPTVVAYA
jgi:hypothetical protein